ncbi:ABC transporter substrate-binding protein [Asanoa sp. NPDC049518]|uniref:ABC transporter substrate-binding protein n=1 Tax=unclassified Asanoa TaxID=2685164 RepID=UPI0034137013
MRTLRAVAAVGAAALLLTMAACSGSDDKAPASDSQNAAEKPLDKVVYMSGFGLFGRESYVYAAIDKGYFREAGLEVEVKPGLGTNGNLKALSSGSVQYASIDLTGAFLEYGRPGGINDFTIVGAVQQRSLTALMALEESGISTPRDLENKTIGAQPGSVNQVLFPTYARLAGIDAGKVKFQNVAPQQQPQLLASKQVDVITQFPVGKPGVERAAGGKKAVVLPYTDVITDLFGGAIGVSKKTAQEKPDQVKRFMSALLKGLSDTISNPQEAGQIYAKFEKTQPAPVAAAEMTLMRPYVDLGTGLGQIDQARAARSIAILQGAGAIPDGLKPEDVISFDLIPKPSA